MNTLRATVWRIAVHFPNAVNSRSADPMATLIQLLESGEFHLCCCSARTGSASGGGGDSAAPAQPPAKKIEARARSFTSPVSEANTKREHEDHDSKTLLSPGFDPAAIADVQRRAAKLGVPFCEECTKAMRAKAVEA